MKVQVKELQGTHRKSSTYPATLDLIGVVDWHGCKDGVPLYGVVFEEEDMGETKKMDFDWSQYKVARCLFNDGPKEYAFAIAKGSDRTGYPYSERTASEGARARDPLCRAQSRVRSGTI